MVQADVTVRLPRLHPGQVRIRHEITQRQARFAVIMCGRRWGKTTDGVEWVTDGAVAGLPCAWMAPTYKLLGEAWREILERLRPMAVKISEQEHWIKLQGGGVVECWTLDSPDPARGRKYARMVVDEAGIVRDLKTIWEQALRPTLVDLSGHARFYGTPKGRTHGFVQLFSRGESNDPGWVSFRAPTKDNPYIPESEIEAARRDLPPAIFAQEFEGVPADDGASPYTLAAVAACLAPISTKEPVVWGWDYARSQDFTVGIGLDRDGYVCRLERWQGVPWGESKRKIVLATGQTPSTGDSTGIGDVIIDDLHALGQDRLIGYHFSQKSKQFLMERLATAVQQTEVRFPDGVIKAELLTFEYEYTAGGVRYSAPAGYHDDAVMALALAVYTFDQHGYVARLRNPPSLPYDSFAPDPYEDRAPAMEPASVVEAPGSMGWLPGEEW